MDAGDETFESFRTTGFAPVFGEVLWRDHARQIDFRRFGRFQERFVVDFAAHAFDDLFEPFVSGPGAHSTKAVVVLSLVGFVFVQRFPVFSPRGGGDVRVHAGVYVAFDNFLEALDGVFVEVALRPVHLGFRT